MASCTRHFLMFEWEHHRWRRRVTAAVDLPAQETDMWGRTVHGDTVRCYKEYICEACGATRGGGSCFCDPAYGDQCEIRLECLEKQAAATASDSRSPSAR
jgi:hypothetical protein